MKIKANQMLVGERWMQDAVVSVQGGCITAIGEGEGDVHVDVLLPAISNLHSHTFQRAMAGMTEYRAAGRESFWTWRELMYRFLDRLTPEQFEAIATMAFVEMQEAGYAAVGEFHYVHHQPGGAPYARLSELSARVFAAAAEAGIGLTHLPVLYSYGGVQQEALEGGQLRFGNTPDRYLRLVEECRAMAEVDARVGIAPHSLRATVLPELRDVLSAVPEGPVHIHIAEQVKEVEDVQAVLGARPVDWLMNTVGVDARWCLIHATHMNSGEVEAVARSGAVAGLCPITEANLGDGIFEGSAYLSAGGAYGVGTDSNVRISMMEELRVLEYSQRLRDRARNVMVEEAGSVGAALYKGAARGGARALGREAGEISVGKWADLMAVDAGHVSLCALKRDQLLDGLVFSAPREVITDVWSAGRHQVQGGRHVAREVVVQRYREAVRALVEAL